MVKENRMASSNKLRLEVDSWEMVKYLIIKELNTKFLFIILKNCGRSFKLLDLIDYL